MEAQLFPDSSRVYGELNVELWADYRAFFQEGLYEGQERHFPAFAATPEFFLEWEDGAQQFRFKGFLRYDVQDNERTHWDLRELYWLINRNQFEFSVGLKKIFWGVTESVHLVDIINQTDAVESFDGEQKLGQPMVHASYVSKIGIWDVFAMPYARKRQFPGREGRLRTPVLLDPSDAIFDHDAEEFFPSTAIRWSNSMGPFDVGVSQFYGTAREPFFQFTPDGNIRELYPIIYQAGLDVLAITGPAIWKLETIVRTQELQDFAAVAAGVEYTIGNIRGSGIDLGIIGEYLYDSRGDLAFTSLDNDWFTGFRLAFNDVSSTEILFGGIVDLARGSQLYSVEASRRFGSSWKMELEVRIIGQTDPDEFLEFFRQDSFAQFRVIRFF
ncbi:MAG: hypothetical protein AAF598_18875 [Bacteroidota bacterium]